MKISRVIGRELYDSRGLPTVGCEIVLENGISVYSSVPSGMSRGRYEAYELRDGGKRLWGKGVLKAVENIDMIIGPELIGKEPDAAPMDRILIELDGTEEKSYLGANALLAVSMALYRAQALAEEIHLFELIAYVFGADTVSLPFPLFNVINGGRHAHNKLTIQECLIVPVGASSFREAMEVGLVFFTALKQVLERHGQQIIIGDEGGFAPQVTSDTQALDFLMEAIEKCVVEEEKQCVIALDMASSQFYDATVKKYYMHGRAYTADELLTWYQGLVETYPIYSIEDGLAEDDLEGWRLMAQVLEPSIQIVGDDIFATNPHRVKKGIEESLANAVVIKPNQIGTVTEALQVARLSKMHGMQTIVSHRSGETEDSFIADFAVGTSAGQFKGGGLCRSDRMAKYNRLLTIEDTLSLSLFDS
jgi:enolase 1/2/3